MDRKENKPGGCGCLCNLPNSGDFKQVISLPNLGLSVYIYKNAEVKTIRKKSEETFILHNIGAKILKRPDYISEMCQYKTYCIKCKMLVQKVRNLIDKINYIKTDDVLGVCEYCNRYPVTKCRKCEYIIGKYISMKNKVYEKNKRARFVSWLVQLNDLLREVLDTKSICKHTFYKECHSLLELQQLFSELKSPLRQRQPDITHFPSITPERSFDALGQSKKMLEDILKTIKTEGSRQYTSDTNLTLTSSRSSTGCVCKYFTNKNMDGRRSMEVLPQEKYYPPGLISSRDFAKRFASEKRYKNSLDRERLGGRSPSAEYRSDYAREETSKERSLHVVSNKISSDYGNESGSRRDQHGKEKISMRDGKESESRRGEYRKEQRSKQEEYGKSRASKKETSMGFKDKLPVIAPQKSKLAKTILSEDGKSKQISKNIKSGDTIKKQTLKEDKAEKHKTGKEENITKKGKKSKKSIFEEGDMKIGEPENGKTKASKLISNSSDIKVTIKDEESRKRLRAKGKLNVSKDKDGQTGKQSEVFQFDSDKDNRTSSKMKIGEKKGSVKKKRSSEAVLLLKMMKEMQMKREKGKGATKEKEKVLVTLEPLPVIERKTKIKVEPALSESFVECDVGKKEEITEMILEKNVAPYDPVFKIEKDTGPKPLLFKIKQTFTNALIQTVEPQMQSEQKYINTRSVKKSVAPFSSIKKSKTPVDIVEASGIVRYQLSNRQFIEKGWTVLPTTKMLKKANTYNMKMANPEFDFFKVNKKKKILFYDTGEKLAEIYSNESGKWFYKNGNLALDCYKPKEPNIKKRYIIYSSGDDKENGIYIPITILGLFDQLGNAVIYDYFGNVRLKYNQSEGVLIDSKIGAPGRWKWHALNDPPVLQPVFLDTYLQERYEDLDEIIKKEEERIKPEQSQDTTFDNMIMIEFDNFVKEKANKLLQKFKPFQIRMKAVKINEHFSMRILDQACVAITFQDAPNTLKLNLGMNLINTEIVDTDTYEVSEVATPYDRIPAKTESVSNIQEALNKARKFGRSIIKRTHSSSTVKRPTKGAVSRQPNTASSE